MLRTTQFIRLVRRFSTAAQSSHNNKSPSSLKNAQKPDSWCLYYDTPAHEPIESTSVFLFPGGLKFRPVGKNILKINGVKDMFEMASSILQTDLLKIYTEGPVEKLAKSIYNQPAIYVTSLAAVKKLQIDSPELVEKCVAAAGFGVGEITGLVYAGAYTFEQGLQLIRTRSEAAQCVCKHIPSGMLAVRLLHDSQLRLALSAAINHCKEDLKLTFPIVCQIACFLGPEFQIVAGNKQALDYIVEHAQQFHLKSVRRLEVEGAFHTPLMLPVVESLKNAFHHIGCARTPCIPVVSNVDAEPYGVGSTISLRLAKQLARPLCWEQSLHALFSRPEDAPFPRIIEVGPGGHLGASLRMVNAKAFAHYQSLQI